LIVVNYLLICRSLTEAQQTARALEHAGILSVVMRTPRGIETAGCGYCVRISERRLPQALSVLKTAGRSPTRIYAAMDGGKYNEVPQ